MAYKEHGEDWFDFRFGPFRMGFGIPTPPFKMGYSRTKDSHILTIHLDPELKKEDLKVRLLKGGILQIEWPRETLEGEEIKVE
ncbi:MAG: hypothetical protein K6U11_01690 [bacterium]|nr:hypothetical protein [bacterium]